MSLHQNIDRADDIGVVLEAAIDASELRLCRAVARAHTSAGRTGSRSHCATRPAPCATDAVASSQVWQEDAPMALVEFDLLQVGVAEAVVPALLLEPRERGTLGGKVAGGTVKAQCAHWASLRHGARP